MKYKQKFYSKEPLESIQIMPGDEGSSIQEAPPAALPPEETPAPTEIQNEPSSTMPSLDDVREIFDREKMTTDCTVSVFTGMIKELFISRSDDFVGDVDFFTIRGLNIIMIIVRFKSPSQLNKGFELACYSFFGFRSMNQVDLDGLYRSSAFNSFQARTAGEYINSLKLFLL